MSPYAEDQWERTTQTINDIFGGFRVLPEKNKKTERGELLRYFGKNLGMSIPAVASVLKSRMGDVSIKDLYYLKSVCDSESGRTFTEKETGKIVKRNFGMVFWSEIKPR